MIEKHKVSKLVLEESQGFEFCISSISDVNDSSRKTATTQECLDVIGRAVRESAQKAGYEYAKEVTRQAFKERNK